VIDSKDLEDTLHVGSAVEITIEVDRGGDLKAYALLSDQGKVIEGVAQLVMGQIRPEDLKASAQSINRRLSSCLQMAFRERDELTIESLSPLAAQMQGILNDLIAIEDDTDTCQRISRNLMEIDAEIELVESREQLAELIEECENSYFNASSVVGEYGDATDKRILSDCSRQFERTLGNARQGEIERLIERLDQLHQSAHEKSPDFYRDVFLHWASLVHVAKNPEKASAIVDKGHAAIENGENNQLQPLIMQLYELIPQQYKTRSGAGSYDSGIY